MLHELHVWDKSQGRQISNASEESMGAISVMRKDFDSKAWATSHDNDFQKLICEARQKVRTNANKDHGALVVVHQTDNQEVTFQSQGISDNASLSPPDLMPPN